MKRINIILLVFSMVFLAAGCVQNKVPEKQTAQPTPEQTIITDEATPSDTIQEEPQETMEDVKLEVTLYNLGRSSIRLEVSNGQVIYIDPYSGGSSGYEKPADLVLVTHQHTDHNQIDLVTLKDTGEIIQCPRQITAGNVVQAQGISIRAVEAYNSNHNKNNCCGFIITIGDLVIYHSGDTSTTDEMQDMAQYDIDYAMLCMDGFYNMGAEEAMEVSDLIRAKYVIPIHTSMSGDYDQVNVDKYTNDNKIVVMVGESLILTD